ncbi:transporter substrate-binding domain-containing protein [Vibrio sp. Of7-15]|uniref:substrate-binding periplasmic protein n=1 Tax=Vibrio sp. Of7-15 TaxID=2724879 RepID=UPI001EF21C9F|nr:transporter substrate-binding domain-containing protein [Vibrio sp. Of7-15]MCG7499439.1 transporter substrate-binding domain-containing protein [Vibrio sp. Of7-15]
MKIRSFVLMALCLALQSIVLPVHALSQPKSVSLVTEPWEPYIGMDLENGGYVTEIVTTAFKRMGYDCLVNYTSWERAIRESKAGHYDGLLGAYYTKERAKHFKFPNPIVESRVALFALKDRGIRFQKLEDLIPYKIGVISSYRYTEEFDHATYLNKLSAYSTRINIKQLLTGRIDLLIGTEEVVYMSLKKHFPQEINSLTPLKMNDDIRAIYLLISKKAENSKQLVQDFNQGLERIINDGTFDAIIKKHNIIPK